MRVIAKEGYKYYKKYDLKTLFKEEGIKIGGIKDGNFIDMFKDNSMINSDYDSFFKNGNSLIDHVENNNYISTSLLSGGVVGALALAAEETGKVAILSIEGLIGLELAPVAAVGAALAGTYYAISRVTHNENPIETYKHPEIDTKLTKEMYSFLSNLLSRYVHKNVIAVKMYKNTEKVVKINKGSLSNIVQAKGLFTNMNMAALDILPIEIKDKIDFLYKHNNQEDKNSIETIEKLRENFKKHLELKNQDNYDYDNNKKIYINKVILKDSNAKNTLNYSKEVLKDFNTKVSVENLGYDCYVDPCVSGRIDNNWFDKDGEKEGTWLEIYKGHTLTREDGFMFSSYDFILDLATALPIGIIKNDFYLPEERLELIPSSAIQKSKDKDL